MTSGKNDRHGARRVWLAAATAVGLLVVSGAAYRVVAGRLARFGDSVPLPPGTLGRLPLVVGDWVGTEVPMDERVVAATDTDDHLSRSYTHSVTGEAVSLFIGYGVRGRDLAPHRPEVCYPDAGWTLQETRRIVLDVSQGEPLQVQVHWFSRGGLQTERVTVLNYYIVDDEYSADVSLLRSKVWRPGGGVRYVAQVLIASEGGVYGAKSAESLAAFGAASAPIIRALLMEATS